MKYLLVVLLIMFSTATFASSKENSIRPEAKWGHFFVGLGEAYAPVDFRAGGPKHEFGLFHGKILGATYIEDLSNHFYMALGGGFYAPAGISFSSISFYAGLGADFWKFWIFNFRSEIGMYSNIANYTGGRINFGINVGF